MTTGVVFDRRYMDHRMGAYHPESPARIEALNRMLEESPPRPFLSLEPRPATEEEVCRVHERGYFELIRSTTGREMVFLDPDTSAGPLTFATALLAAGGLLESVDRIMDGTVGNALALVRPPGHHAEASEARGFCIFNNVAIAAEHLVRKHRLRKILIVDWDLHHGNGTQHAFYARRDVLYFSTHQYPYFPGTGSLGETGTGEGFGYNLNVPLRPGKDDGDYLAVYRKILEPVARAYEPEFVLVSAGFDICAGDPLGGMAVTREGIGHLASLLLGIACRFAGGRVAFVLEGGYELMALVEGVAEVLIRLSSPGASDVPEAKISGRVRAELAAGLEVAGRTWDLPALD